MSFAYLSPWYIDSDGFRKSWITIFMNNFEFWTWFWSSCIFVSLNPLWWFSVMICDWYFYIMLALLCTNSPGPVNSFSLLLRSWLLLKLDSCWCLMLIWPFSEFYGEFLYKLISLILMLFSLFIIWFKIETFFWVICFLICTSLKWTWEILGWYFRYCSRTCSSDSDVSWVLYLMANLVPHLF